MSLFFYTCKFAVNEDASAVFADDDFLVRLDIQLSLWRNLCETSATGITLHRNDTKTVACVFADTFERCKQTWFYFFL